METSRGDTLGPAPQRLWTGARGPQGPSGRPATRGTPPTTVYRSTAGKGLTRPNVPMHVDVRGAMWLSRGLPSLFQYAYYSFRMAEALAQLKWGVAVVVTRVQACASLHQQAHRVSLPRRHRHVERREAVLGARLQRGATGDQRVGDVAMSQASCKVQRRRAIRPRFGIDLHVALPKQGRDCGRFTFLCGHMQRSEGSDFIDDHREPDRLRRVVECCCKNGIRISEAGSGS